MKISNYLKNEEIKLTNDDIDIERLTNDLRRGYVPETDIESRIDKAKKDLSAEKDKEYSTLKSSYDDMVSKYDSANKELGNEKLKNVMLTNGFKAENFDEVSNIRKSLYKDVEDDNEAVQKIAERFKNTYFPESQKAPSEPPIKGNQEPKKNEIKVTRNTSIKDLMIRKD